MLLDAPEAKHWWAPLTPYIASWDKMNSRDWNSALEYLASFDGAEQQQDNKHNNAYLGHDYHHISATSWIRADVPIIVYENGSSPPSEIWTWLGPASNG